MFFGGARHIFGWYHPAQAPARGCGVVLVPPLGHEYVCGYRAYRHLAERLATTGFAVLRFDYAGTGNSAGEDSDDGLVPAWLESISLAIDELRACSGERRIALVGLRVGATLAVVTAAERGDVDALALWAPCISGREYVRQITMLGMMTEPPHPATPTRDGVEAAGFFLSTATAQALSAIDLLRVRQSPASHVLLLERDDLPRQQLHDELVMHLRQRGAAVDVEQFDGYPLFMLAPIESTLPHTALRQIVGWFDRRYPAPISTAPHTNHPLRHGARAALASPPVTEEGVRFGNGLFGILTEPAPGTPHETAVVFPSTGGDHHVGPHRLYVSLARRWGALGFATLRFDLSGLGDSPPRSGNAEQLTYPPGAVDDVRAAVAYLRNRSGARRIVIVGICSGGYHAVHAAHEQVPVAGLIAVNPPLYWHPGEGFGASVRLDPRWETTEARRLRRALLSWTKWKGLLQDGRGASDTLRLLREHAAAVGRDILAPLRRDALAGEEHDVISLFARDVRTHLIFSQYDPGLMYLERLAGPGLEVLRARDTFSLDVVDGADHTFMPLQWQHRLSELLTVRLLHWAEVTSAGSAA